MAYSVAVIQSGIYLKMQTLKAVFIFMICVCLLVACGLKGPLYLPPADVAEKPVTETPSSESIESKEEEEKEAKSSQKPAFIL